MKVISRRNAVYCTLLGLLTVVVVLVTRCNRAADSVEPAESNMEYAELLSISPQDGYTSVEVRTEAKSKPAATYLLLPEGASKPSGVEGEVIRVPVKSLVVNTSVYAYPLKELNALQVVKGVTDASYFTMPEIKAGLKSGTVADIGNSQSPSVEKIVELAPDGILINLFEGMNMGQFPLPAYLTSNSPTTSKPHRSVAPNG